MTENLYLSEGGLINLPENNDAISTATNLERAMQSERILEARAILCDSGHNLIVELGSCKGIIPREEVALGIADGSVRDIAIITRVNKPVCFKVTKIVRESSGHIVALLSRAAAQAECIEKRVKQFKCGDIISAKITHMEPFGAFADIGCGVIAMLPIDSISISRISHPKDRFFVGQTIKSIVKEIDYETGRVTLSHKELLGTWEENAADFLPGQTVSGIIRSVEEYGVFVELAPNLAGLAEWKENIRPSQQCAVFIKSVIPEKMKIKLVIIDYFDAEYSIGRFNYYINEGHIDRWAYSPDCCPKIIETVFGEVPCQVAARELELTY